MVVIFSFLVSRLTHVNARDKMAEKEVQKKLRSQTMTASKSEDFLSLLDDNTPTEERSNDVGHKKQETMKLN